MNTSTARRIAAIAALATGALFATTSARASDVHWSVGINAPLYPGEISTVISNGRHYSPPPPVYVQPAPIYYAPPPVYYRHAPVVVHRWAPAPHYRHWNHHRHHDRWHHDRWHDRRDGRGHDHNGRHNHRHDGWRR